ncbi:MAG: FkbM family methyltransferase, partial [Planctomycetota bacterium]
MLPVYKATRFLPIKVGICGKRRDLPMGVMQRICPLGRSQETIADGFAVDNARPNERLLSYFFYNVRRYYRASPLFRVMREHLAPGQTFLDIGANLGFYSYLAKRDLGCGTETFEPEPAHFAFLERNRRHYGGLHNLALSDDDGTVRFHVANTGNPGASSLVSGDSGPDATVYDRAIDVQARRLDSLLTDPGRIGAIGMAKIDVEGAEAAVVAGMSGVLERNRFPIWCEVRGPQSGR